MKKLSSGILAGLMLFLTACGSISSPQSVSGTTSDALSTETQLVLGTLNLDGTQQAVTTSQADDLLVMWQVYQELNSSGTAAQAEIDGLLEQIQETMTAEQMQAISDMDLTQQDVFTLMQTQGASMGQARQSSSSSNSSTQSGTGFAPPDGGMAGGPPDAGMAGGAPSNGDMGEISAAGSSVSTGQTQGTGTGAGESVGTSIVLIDTLIQYLQKVANA